MIMSKHISAPSREVEGKILFFILPLKFMWAPTPTQFSHSRIFFYNYTKNSDLSLFCKKIISLFIFVKLDIDILIFYKLVPYVICKDEITLNKTPIIR